MSVIEFRVCLKKVWTVWDKTDLSFFQLDFPAGKMVSYSKFKECHLDLSSLKRSAAFLDKLEIDDLSLNYFFKNNGLLFHHMTNHANSTMLLTHSLWTYRSTLI